MTGDLSQFIQVIRRIPLFQSLKPEQAVMLLKICSRISLDTREQLCAFGEQSRDMFILLSGKLSIRTGEGIQVATVSPIAPVGEMGIFTGEPRSTTVLAAEPSTLFGLSKTQLDALMRRNPDIEIAISRSLISTLSARLRDANGEIVHMQKLFADIEEGRRQALEEEERAEQESGQ